MLNKKKKVYKFQNRLTEIISEPCLIKREVEKWWYFKVEKEISKERKSNYTHESKITYFPLLEKHQSTILMPQKKKNYSLLLENFGYLGEFLRFNRDVWSSNSQTCFGKNNRQIQFGISRSNWKSSWYALQKWMKKASISQNSVMKGVTASKVLFPLQ